MHDKEYIKGFYNNDEVVIGLFYKEHKDRFIMYFKTHYQKSHEYLIDIFQESCVILWQNIHDLKLREDNLSSSLATYLLSIGKYTMMAKDRKYKEIIDEAEIYKLRFVADDAEELRNKIERENHINDLVSKMKSPCAELLRAFYWDRLSGLEIAVKFGYSGPDSVKTQKHKCMGKLKQLIKSQLEE